MKVRRKLCFFLKRTHWLSHKIIRADPKTLGWIEICHMNPGCDLSLEKLQPGLKVIKLELILRLKKKTAMIGCLRTRVHNQPIFVLYFESETVLKFYNL